MTLRLVILPRAEQDAQEIFGWITQRAPEAARRWWVTFETAARQVIQNPAGYSLAPEDDHFEQELRQFLFRTRKGRTFRGIFVVVEDEVRILRIRSPGQKLLQDDDLTQPE